MLKKKSNYWVILVFLAIALLLLPSLIGCTKKSSSPTGVTIIIGIVSDMTGATANTAIGEIWGWEDAAKWGKETNLVPGVNFEIITYDNKFDVGRSINGYEMIKGRNASVTHVQMTGANYALKDKYATDKIVAMIPPAPKALHPPGWAFTADMAYTDQAAAAYQWLLEDWKKEGKSGKPKMGWLTWDADYGHSGLIVNWYASEIGIEVLQTEFYGPGPVPSDVTSQLLRLKDKGANYVVSVGPDIAWANILKDANKLGLSNSMKFVGVANVIFSADLAKVAQEAAEGSYLVMANSSLYEDNLPGVQMLRQMQEKYRGEWRDNLPGVRGWLSMQLIMEAVKQAIEKDNVKPEQVNGEVIKASLEKNINNFDTGGLSGPLTITPDNHSASRMAKVFQMRGGKHLPITDFFEAPHMTRFEDVKK